jgi:hypothetical protein
VSRRRPSANGMLSQATSHDGFHPGPLRCVHYVLHPRGFSLYGYAMGKGFPARSRGQGCCEGYHAASLLDFNQTHAHQSRR